MNLSYGNIDYKELKNSHLPPKKRMIDFTK